MFWHPIFYFTGIYFLIGAIANTIIATKKTAAEKKGLWLKFGIYFLVVHIVILSVLVSHYVFTTLAVIISISGIYEIRKARKNKPEARIIYRIYLSFFLIASLLFIEFSFFRAGFILYVYLLVISFDGFSQLCGQLFGRHKLIPKVSPNKTTEGLTGGLIFCILTSVFIRNWLAISVINSMFFGLGIGVSAFTGDLLASYYKRKMGIKDFGTIIPGHGGVLDRFDSFIAASSITVLLALAFKF
jgi:phosphatidate cytidylyltransferase